MYPLSSMVQDVENLLLNRTIFCMLLYLILWQLSASGLLKMSVSYQFLV